MTRAPGNKARAQGAAVAAALAGALLLGAGCLGTPDVEDGWTRVDLQAYGFTPAQPLVPGSTCTVTASTAITYRRIVTGFAVTELRASSVPPTSIVLGPDEERMPMAQAIDLVLPNSVSLGRFVRPITGWDHLIQRIDQTFTAQLPAGVDSSGAPINVYLVSYLGSGEEIERPGQSDTIIVTPFVSTQAEVLPVGVPVVLAGQAVP